MRASSSVPSDRRSISGALAFGGALLSGHLFLLSFPPFGYGAFIWVALVPVLLLRHRCSWPALLGLAYLMVAIPVAGIGYNVAIFHRGAFAVLVLGVPAVFALGILAAHTLERGLTGSWARLVTFPACAVAVEYGLSSGCGVPATIALSQAATPLVIQSADVFGTAGITFLIVLVNCALEQLLLWAQARSRGERPSVSVVGPVALTVAALMANLTYGAAALAVYGRDIPSVRIASVQPAISTELYRERWFNPAAQQAIDRTMRELTDQALATAPALLFLSEGGDGRYTFRQPALRRQVRELARHSTGGLVIASPDLTAAGDELNAVFSVAPDGTLLGRTAKRLLTPVGEEHLEGGGVRRPLETPAGRVGALVCFESCFATVARELVRAGAEFLLVTTSDAPFRNGSLPLLHSAFSSLRAVETRRYVVQAANTGPSMVVSPTGETVAQSPFLAATVLTGSVAPLRTLTLYTRIGDVLPFAALAWVLLGAWRLGHAARTEPKPRRTRRRAAALGRITLAGARGRAYRLGAASLLYTCALLGMVALSITASTRATEMPTGIAASVERFLATPQVPDGGIAQFLQQRPNTCGPAALAFALRFYSAEATEAAITRLVSLDAGGTTMLDLVRAAEHYGMRAVGERLNWAALRRRHQPTIAYLERDHFVVVIEAERRRVLLFDPALGLVRMPAADFRGRWNGYALLLAFPPDAQLDDDVEPMRSARAER